MADMYRYALVGDFDKAEEINARLMRLHHDLFIESINSSEVGSLSLRLN